MVFGPAPADEGGSLPTRCVATLAGHEGAVLNVRYNAGGQYALSCGKDRTLRLWSLSKGALIKAYAGHGHEARGAAGARHGRQSAWRALAGASGAAQTLGHVFADALLRGGAQVRDVACWPDNSKLVSVGGDKQARPACAGVRHTPR
jgi:WD40 repeat protein